MSRYATILSLDGESHTEECASHHMDEGGERYSIDELCDCPAAQDMPLIYQGSNHEPHEDDRRGGFLGLATFVSGDDGVGPFLRLSVREDTTTDTGCCRDQTGHGDATVVLDRRLAEQVRDALSEWLVRSTTPLPDMAALAMPEEETQ